MKNNWQTKKLGEICIFVRGPFGGSLKKQIFVKDGYAVYEQAHAIYNQFSDIRYFIDEKKFDEMKRFELKSGNLIMSCSGTMGKIAIVPEGIQKGIINQALLQLSPGKNLLNTYLKLWIEGEGFQESLKAYSKGAAIRNVASVKILKDIEILLPPRSEQKRIVKNLDEVFEGIAKAKENTEKNLQNSRELFESYLQSVFTEISGGWEEKKLGDKDLLKIVDGDRGKNYPKKSDFLSEGYCLFLNTKNVRPDGFDFNTKMFVTCEKDKAMGNGKLERGDVLLTTRGTIGNISVYDDSVPFENVRINSGMLIFRSNTKLITPKYLFAIFKSGIMKSQIKKYVSGAAQPQLPIKTLVNFSIPVPKSISEQNTIVKKLDELLEQTKRLEEIYKQKLADLEELKKSVLSKAFAGEL